MCFSFEASIISFFVGSLSSIWIFLLGRPFDKIIGGYWLYVCLMQGIEAILWKHQTCDDLHKTVSFLGYGLNVSQPLILGGLLILYSKYARPIPIVIVSLLYMLYGLTYFLRTRGETYYCITTNQIGAAPGGARQGARRSAGSGSRGTSRWLPAAQWSRAPGRSPQAWSPATPRAPRGACALRSRWRRAW